MMPMIQRLQHAYDLTQVTVVADAGMFSARNKQAIIDAGLGYILGVRFSQIPYPIAAWRQQHPDTDYTDQQV